MSEKIPWQFRNGVRGVVRDLEKRETSTGQGIIRHYIGFRLERVDAMGNPVEQIPVELYGRKVVSQSIKNGDPVIVRGRRNQRGVMTPDAVYVVNTGSIVHVRRVGCIAILVGLPLILLTLISFPAFLVGVLMLIAGASQGILLIIASIAIILIYFFFNSYYS